MTLLMTIFILSCTLGSAQTTSDFESFGLAADSFLNGSDGSMGFSDGNIRLQNEFAGGFWSGWAISTTTDSTTAGFTNQYSCIAGSGVNNSDTYATAFVLGASFLHTINEAKGGVVEGFYINNATYAYRSMLEGDQFAKRFGGEDGTDPDFFYVSIKEHGSRNVVNDSIIFYLADYRSDDPAEDYIVNDWTYIDLTRFENVDTLAFSLYSSDNGAFGMNTPAYFCIDDFVTTDMALTSSEETINSRPSAYPNPSMEKVILENATDYDSYYLYALDGNIVKSGPVTETLATIYLEDVPSGGYIIRLTKKRTEDHFIRITKI